MSLDWTALSDGELATLSIAGRQAAFAEIMRRYRSRFFGLRVPVSANPMKRLIWFRKPSSPRIRRCRATIRSAR